MLDLDSRIEAFRHSIRSTNNECDKFQLCVNVRDELLAHHTELKWLFACIEEVMQAECTQYKKAKSRWLNAEAADVDKKRWELFLGVANAGATLKRECLAPLTKASAGWGNEKVQYYKWASMGWKYCKVLGTAATRNPSWTEASIKLNQLLLRRIISRRALRMSTNPLELMDLEYLKKWQGQSEFRQRGRNRFELQYQPILNSEIPSGYAFDQYGLIVHKEFGSVQEEIFGEEAQSTSVEARLNGTCGRKTQHSPVPLRTLSLSQVDLPEVLEGASTLVDENWIQSTLLSTMSQSCSSPVTSRALSRQLSASHEEQQSSLSATTNNQPMRRVKRTAGDIEFEDLMCLMHKTLTLIESKDHSISNRMVQIDKQRESLRMQLPREADRFPEPSTQCTKQKIRDMDEEWTKQDREKRSLRESYKRRCLIFLRGTGW